MIILCVISLTLNIALLLLIALFLAFKRNIFSSNDIVDKEAFNEFFGR